MKARTSSRPGGARYRALYLGGSSRKMSLAALRRLAALVEGGATVVGLRPEGSPGLAGDAAEYAALVEKLWPGTRPGVARHGQGDRYQGHRRGAATKSASCPISTITGAMRARRIPFVHRQLADGDSYFLVNQQRTAPRPSKRDFGLPAKRPNSGAPRAGRQSPSAI